MGRIEAETAALERQEEDRNKHVTAVEETTSEDDYDDSLWWQGNASDEDASQEPAALPVHVPMDAPPLATVTLGDDEPDDGTLSSYDGDPDEEKELEELPNEEDQIWSTPMEDKQMEKARVYYIYKRHTVLEEAIARHDPISGIIIQAKDGSPQMYLIYKVPGKKFGWKKVSFNDAEGTHVCGLWYAPITVEEVDAPPSTTTEITKLAKLATVAVPLRYPVGDTHPDGLKYCVITNWWRERNEKGQYVLPSLAFEVYQE